MIEFHAPIDADPLSDSFQTHLKNIVKLDAPVVTATNIFPPNAPSLDSGM